MSLLSKFMSLLQFDKECSVVGCSCNQKLRDRRERKEESAAKQRGAGPLYARKNDTTIKLCLKCDFGANHSDPGMPGKSCGRNRGQRASEPKPFGQSMGLGLLVPSPCPPRILIAKSRQRASTARTASRMFFSVFRWLKKLLSTLYWY